MAIAMALHVCEAVALYGFDVDYTGGGLTGAPNRTAVERLSSEVNGSKQCAKYYTPQHLAACESLGTYRSAHSWHDWRREGAWFRALLTRGTVVAR